MMVDGVHFLKLMLPLVPSVISEPGVFFLSFVANEKIGPNPLRRHCIICPVSWRWMNNVERRRSRQVARHVAVGWFMVDEWADGCGPATGSSSLYFGLRALDSNFFLIF